MRRRWSPPPERRRVRGLPGAAPEGAAPFAFSKGPIPPMTSSRARHPAGPAAGPSSGNCAVAEEVRHALSTVFARAEFRDPDLFDLHVDGDRGARLA